MPLEHNAKHWIDQEALLGDEDVERKINAYGWARARVKSSIVWGDFFLSDEEPKKPVIKLNRYLTE